MLGLLKSRVGLSVLVLVLSSLEWILFVLKGSPDQVVMISPRPEMGPSMSDVDTYGP